MKAEEVWLLQKQSKFFGWLWHEWCLTVPNCWLLCGPLAYLMVVNLIGIYLLADTMLLDETVTAYSTPLYFET